MPPPLAAFSFSFLLKKRYLLYVSICYRTVYQDYCEAMSSLSLQIMELLGVSLGVDRNYFKDFFEGNDSVMRLNYYPTCQNPDLALGTGPHCDPTSLTILHQDQVVGLQVFVDGKWCSVYPREDAFVVNIGDTFMVWFMLLECCQVAHTIHNWKGSLYILCAKSVQVFAKKLNNRTFNKQN